MKRLFLLIGILGLSVAFLSGCLIEPVSAQTTDREWLILVYVNAINDRGLDGGAKELINQLEKVGSSDKITIVVKYGILDADANKALKFPDRLVTVKIQKDGGDPAITSPEIDSSPRQDMSSESSLYLFARKNVVQYPSKKLMLLYFGKGDGWNGLGQDDLSRKSMSIDSLAGALSKIAQAAGKKIDLLVTDADFMQTVEVAYGLKDYVDVIVGSEEKEPRRGFEYDFIFEEALNNPSIDPQKLANSVVYFSENLSTSAVNTARFSGFMPLLDRWAELMVADPIAMKIAAAEVKKTFSFGLKDSRDLCEFIERVIKALPEQHPAAKAGQDLWNYTTKELMLASHKTYIDQNSGAIVYKPEYDMLRGLSIYLPDLRYNASMYERMKFTSNSKWGSFILALLDGILKAP